MRTREDILADIEYCTKWAKYRTECAEDQNKRAEKHTEMANECKQELKKYDEENK